MTATEARTMPHDLASPEVAAASARFFKTGPGQYGEGDTFIGVRTQYPFPTPPAQHMQHDAGTALLDSPLPRSSTRLYASRVAS